MRAWFFSENAYHLLPDAKEYDSIRVKLPNRYYDPKLGADLYHRFIDEWKIAEDMGLEIMVNEHHQTATNLNPGGPIVMGILARETRDIPDIFALHPQEVTALQYRDPGRFTLDHAKLSDEQLTAIARSREATALYAWEPYFHNPKLRARLRRITSPTLLLWGADDRFVTAEYYGAAYRDAIPGARLETIPGAGHFPHLEEPEALVARVRGFLDARPA